MRNSLWIILAVLFVAIGAPTAHADMVGTITFTPTYGDTATAITGSFGYNTFTNEFTYFTVNWGGDTFDLTSSANLVGLTGTENTLYAGCIGATSGQTIDIMLTSPTCYNGNPMFKAYDGFRNNGFALLEIEFGDILPWQVIIAAGAQDPDPNNVFFGGNLTGSQALATPEPFTLGLTTIGIGLLGLVMRKRIPLGH